MSKTYPPWSQDKDDFTQRMSQKINDPFNIFLIFFREVSQWLRRC